MKVVDIDLNMLFEYWGLSSELISMMKISGLCKFQILYWYWDGYLILVEVDLDFFEYDGQMYFIVIVCDVSV